METGVCQMLSAGLNRFEVVSIYKGLESHPDKLYIKVWRTEKSKVALFLVERKMQYSHQRMLITATLEFDPSIELHSLYTDDPYEYELDQPAGQVAIFSPRRGFERPLDLEVHTNELQLLIDLKVIPWALNLEAKCIWCKEGTRFVKQDIGEDMLAKCPYCGERISLCRDSD
jgi:DNA-directed RNA polymerase subunit RPC12/RpoP